MQMAGMTISFSRTVATEIRSLSWLVCGDDDVNPSAGDSSDCNTGGEPTAPCRDPAERPLSTAADDDLTSCASNLADAPLRTLHCLRSAALPADRKFWRLSA
mmetsp:Transcript_18494/g.60539  ORF Transcript_18494/g.60539 Transcript_18494/m.60539 type:complete len:102 (-) Transcript_18494:1012-1317(-)